MGLPWDAYYVLTKAEARLTNSKIHPNSGAPDYDISHAVADISDIDTSYLAIDGSNANTEIDIGSEDFTTLGTGTFGALQIDDLYFIGDNILSGTDVIDLRDNVIVRGNLTVEEEVLIDVTNTKALYVRKDGDAGDVFIVDTVNNYVGIGAPPTAWPLEISHSKAGIRLRRFNEVAAARGAFVAFHRSRGSVGAPENVLNGDEVAKFLFGGYHTDWENAAEIQVVIDGAPGVNNMPGRMHFKTTPGGSDTPVTRMTIKSDGKIGKGTLLPAAGFHNVGTAMFGDDDEDDHITIDETGDVVFVGGAGLVLGEIWAHNVTDAITSVAQNDWDQIVAFDTDGESNDTTPANGTDDITILKAGKYRVSFQWSGYSAAVPHDWDFHISKNNNASQFDEITQHQTSSVAARLYSVSATGIITCAVNDTIEMWVKRTSAGNNIVLTTTACNITVTQIGG